MKLFSPGKLLITSEYVVLDGALALALPTKLGQEGLFCEEKDGEAIVRWEAYHQGKLWLRATIDYKNWRVVDCNLSDSAQFVCETLQVVQALSQKVLQNNHTYIIRTNLQFPANFGLGSSSTLMNNLASWAGIDAFQLNAEALGGSGYDIAVAQMQKPILFKNCSGEIGIQTVDFNPSFKDELLFIHLNQKQDSREGIRLYRSKVKDQGLIESFSAITNAVIKASTSDEFSSLMELHEGKISQLIEFPTVKEKFFADAPVFFKSLGAWGGDFILTKQFDDYKNYFQNKGFSTIFTYNDLIL